MKRLIACCVAGFFAIAAVGAANAQTVVYEHTFDGVANDSTPAMQTLSNGSGDPLPVVDLATGLIGPNLFTSASGFNTTSGIDLSGLDEFTIEYVVSNNYSGIADSTFNGSFFGIVNSPTANATDGTALYNNAGGQAGPPVGVSLGLTVGAGRGVAGPDFVVDQVGGNGTFFPMFNDPDTVLNDNVTDGYTILIHVTSQAETGNALVSVFSCGLETGFDSVFLADVNYATLAANITLNVSSQGGTLDLERITIIDGPPSCPPVILGDVDQNGEVNFLDIAPFITILSSNGFQFEADINEDDMVSFLDIALFIGLLSQ